MEVKRAKIVGKSLSAFRSGEAAFIIGVVMVKPSLDRDERLCFHIIFDDGQTDYVPISEVFNGNYRTMSE